jgi:hypothetical protein
VPLVAENLDGVIVANYECWQARFGSGSPEFVQPMSVHKVGVISDNFGCDCSSLNSKTIADLGTRAPLIGQDRDVEIIARKSPGLGQL